MAPVLVSLATVGLGACGGSGEAGAIKNAAREYFESGSGRATLEHLELQNKESNHAFVDAVTDTGHHVVVEVVKEGPRWVAEHCVDPMTHEVQSCSE